MSEYKHILLAIDLSENTSKMLSEVKYVVKKFNAKLSIVHVTELMPMAYQTDVSLPNSSTDAQSVIDAEIKKKLYELGKSLNVPKSACYLETGAKKIAITELAQKIGANLIIIGSNSHSGIEKLLNKLGNAILNIASCSVLVIKLEEANVENEKR
jgi:universal stress protein A